MQQAPPESAANISDFLLPNHRIQKINSLPAINTILDGTNHDDPSWMGSLSQTSLFNNGRSANGRGDKNVNVRSNRLNDAGDVVSFDNQVAVIVEADTFEGDIALEFKRVATGNQATAREALMQGESESVLQFQLEAVDTRSNQIIEETFDKPVRLVVDVRELGIELDSDQHQWTLYYENEDEPGEWLAVPTTTYQDNGLLSADVNHFSNWAVGAAPEQWNLSWTPPAVSGFSGAATYAHDLELPAGRGGLQPSANLSYSSRGIDGRLQLMTGRNLASGWNLADTKIVRDGVRVEQQGPWYTTNCPSNMNACPVYVHPDKFRLVLKGAGYELIFAETVNANTTRYSVKDAPQIRVLRHFDVSAPNYDGLYWTVTTGEGTTYRMGFTADSEQYQQASHHSQIDISGHRGNNSGSSTNHSNRTASGVSWHLDSVRDVNGNMMTYHYNHKLESKTLYPRNDTFYQNPIAFKEHNNRLAYVVYNYKALQADSTPDATPFHPSTDEAATLIRFAFVASSSVNEFDLWSTRRLHPITRVAVYHQPNLKSQLGNNFSPLHPNTAPIIEYRLTRGESAFVNDCNGGTQTTGNSYISKVQQFANVDSNLRSNDGVGLPATEFTYATLSHNVGNNSTGQQCRFKYLSQVKNGYGGNSTFTYASDGRFILTYNEICAENLAFLGCQWAQHFGNSYYVTQMLQNDGRNSYKTTYQYGPPCYDQTSQGHLGNGTQCQVTQIEPPEYGGLNGFKWSQSKVYAENGGGLLTRTRTTYHVDDQNGTQLTLIGKPKNVKVFNSANQLVHESNTTYQKFGFDGTTFTRATVQEETKKDPKTNLSLTTKVKYFYDASLSDGKQLGHATVVRYMGDTSYLGDERTVMTRYHPNNSSTGVWIVSAPAEQRTYQGRYSASQFDSAVNSNELLVASQTIYDHPANPANLPPTQGRPVAGFMGAPGKEIDGSVNGWISTGEIEYDEYGNVKRQRDVKSSMGLSGVETMISYDGEYHLFPEVISDTQGNRTTFEFYEFTAGTGVPNRPYGLLKRVDTQLTLNNTNDIATVFYEYDPFRRLHTVYDDLADRGVPGNIWDGDPAMRYRYADNSWNSSVSGLDPANDKPFMTIVESRPASFPKPGSSTATVDYNYKDLTFHDGFGRPIQTMQTFAQVEGQTDYRDSLVNTITYGAHGHPVCQTAQYSVPHYQDRGLSWPDSSFDPTNCTSRSHTATQYDDLGRVAKVIAPSGSETRYYPHLKDRAHLENKGRGSHAAIPAGQVFHTVAAVDALGQHKGLRWTDVNGQLRFITEYSGSSGPHPLYGLTEYTYDGSGYLTKVTDTQGNTTSIEYDRLGRKTAMDDPDMGYWEYTYDAVGNLIHQKDAKNQSLCFYHDAANRLTGKTDNGSATTCPATPTAADTLASYVYDTLQYGLGQVASVSWQSQNGGHIGSDSFIYDAQGRATSQTRTLDGRAFTMTTTAFDVLDRPMGVIYPDGSNVAIGYDREGGNTLTVDGTMLVEDVRYNERGQMVALERGNGRDTLFTYYGKYNNFGLYKAETPTVQTFEYQYDLIGNITQVSETQSGDVQTFGYDFLSRLVTAQATGGVADYNHSYSYDPLGNMLGMTTTTETRAYDYTNWAGGTNCPTGELNHAHGLPHAVKAVNSDYFCYDANGNMTKRHEGGTDFFQLFDGENRLTHVQDNVGAVTRFDYDATGQRMKTTDETTNVEIFYPFPGYELEVQTDGTEIERMTYSLEGQAIVQRVKDNANRDDWYYIHTDHLGSSTVMTFGHNNPNGNLGNVDVSSYARYLPFGGYRGQPTSNSDISDSGFTGHKHNDSVGLIYMNARFYVPSINRFASADTIVPDPVNSQSYNRYSYVENRPINLNDPSGHCGEGENLELGETESCTTIDNADDAQELLDAIDAYLHWYERDFIGFLEAMGILDIAGSKVAREQIARMLGKLLPELSAKAAGWISGFVVAGITSHKADKNGHTSLYLFRDDLEKAIGVWRESGRDDLLLDINVFNRNGQLGSTYINISLRSKISIEQTENGQVMHQDMLFHSQRKAEGYGNAFHKIFDKLMIGSQAEIGIYYQRRTCTRST
ncbi:MAG: RHS repeat-associated core domain-containing protein, partial [Candidatus Promineifilaceae bacterium]